MDTLRHYSTRLRSSGSVILGAVALLAIAWSWMAYGRAAAAPEGGPAPAARQTGAMLSSDIFTLYLPSTYQNLTLQQPIFGVQMNFIDASHGMTYVVEAQSNWVRAGGVDWAAVEATQGVYNWSALAANEAQWEAASANGLTALVIVGHTPAWAQAQPGKACGPIRPDKLAAFGNFLNALVQRYRQPPYNLKYWEIWNEPDVDSDGIPGESTFGCWGDNDDAYYGGGYYGQMLQVIYPRIKAADLSARVLIGGLLLDCDPNNPPVGKDCRPARFFEGILRQVGGASFDGVGVHAYDFYGGSLGVYSSPNWHSASNNASGPNMVMEAKIKFVRDLMAAYGVTGKYVMNNESGVGLFTATTNDTYETTKAYYLAQVYATAASEHLLANIWYSLDDTWHHQELLDTSYVPKPAYYAYKFAVQQLLYARYIQPIPGSPGVKGYVFDVLGHAMWVLWSKDGAVHALTLPSTPVSIRDVDGTSLAINGNQLSIGPEPLYVEYP